MDEENTKPRTFDEALKSMKGEAAEPPVLDENASDVAQSDELEKEPDEEQEKEPAWTEEALPEGLKIPPGKEIFFVRIPAHLTDRKDAGDRVLVIWTLSLADERMAAKRSSGESMRLPNELTKQMIRAIDGKRVDWATSGNHVLDKLLQDVGPKGRVLLNNLYHRKHSVKVEEQIDFFVNCVRSGGGGA